MISSNRRSRMRHAVQLGRVELQHRGIQAPAERAQQGGTVRQLGIDLGNGGPARRATSAKEKWSSHAPPTSGTRSAAGLVLAFRPSGHLLKRSGTAATAVWLRPARASDGPRPPPLAPCSAAKAVGRHQHLERGGGRAARAGDVGPQLGRARPVDWRQLAGTRPLSRAPARIASSSGRPGPDPAGRHAPRSDGRHRPGRCRKQRSPRASAPRPRPNAPRPRPPSAARPARAAPASAAGVGAQHGHAPADRGRRVGHGADHARRSAPNACSNSAIGLPAAIDSTSVSGGHQPCAGRQHGIHHLRLHGQQQGAGSR